MAATMIGLIALGACGDRERSDASSGDTISLAPGDPAAAGAMRSDTADPRAGGASGLTDADIVALLDEANKADSASGAYAFGKATNPDVKGFAKLMMGEHHALRVQGQQLAKKLNVKPQLPADNPLKPAVEAEMAALKSAPKGTQFDRTYIDQEIAIHKAVINLAEQAHGAAQHPELKALIEKAKPVLEKHLDRAEELQEKLGKPSA